LADAVAALEDETALTMRDPFPEDEERWITLGLDAPGRVLVVVYTWRGERVRLISARHATPRERRRYEESNERSKNSCCLRFSASKPFSMSSTSIRLALSLRAFAKLRTWAATFAGKVTLCRTTLFAILMTP
jgi:uncharacterized DUF497 family protein